MRTAQYVLFKQIPTRFDVFYKMSLTVVPISTDGFQNYHMQINIIYLHTFLNLILDDNIFWNISLDYNLGL